MRTLRRLLGLLPVIAGTLGGLTPLPGAAAEPETLLLPPPTRSGGMPLQSALSARKTTRELDSRPLPPQLLGDLLWSAFGINRTNSGHRTAPSAMNSQEIEMYVALAEGLYRYDAPTHRLLGVAKGDFRGKVSAAEYSAKAAAVLIYVAELPKLAKARPELRPFYAGIDTGCIVQNVYLYCASAGLGTVVFDLDRPPLAKAMGLAEGQEVIMAQGVGGAR